MSGKVAPIRVEGQMPLCDIDAEAAVLSTLILEPSRFGAVASLLSARHFFSDAHRQVFGAIGQLQADSRSVDIVSLAKALRDQGKLDRVGGTPFLAQLVDATPATAHVMEHARCVAEYAKKRRIATDAENLATGIRQGESLENVLPRIEGLKRVASEERESGLPLLGADEIFAPLPNLDWIVRELDLCASAPSLFAGFGFSAKTMSAQSLLLSVATGVPVWGMYPTKKGKALHVDYEQGARLTRERYQRLAKGLSITPAELAGNLVLSSLPSLHLDHPGAEDVLCQALDGFTVALFDSLRAAAPSHDENSSDMRASLDMLNRVSERTGCAAIVIHHARKPQKEAAGGSKMAIRGSGAIFDACSSVLLFEGSKGEATTVHHEKARNSGRLAPQFQLRVEDVEVGGNPRAGLIVVGNSLPSSVANSPGATLESLKERIREHFRTHGDQTSKGALREHLSCNRDHLFSALNEMIGSGEIVDLGKHPRRPLLRLLENQS